MYWDALMIHAGPRGRAEILAKGAPHMAFDLLMRTPEDELKYGPEWEEACEMAQQRAKGVRT